MKTISNIRFAFLAMALVIAITSSCSKKDDKIFEDTASIRVEKAKKQLQTDLKSSAEGWKLVYFPMTTQELSVVPAANTSFTFLFKFLDDTQVQAVSSFRSKPETSEYDLVLGSSLKLQFSTYNMLHELANAGYRLTGMGGQSYGGEFEFLYYGKKGDDLIFKTNREHTELRFERATAEDWKNLYTLESVFKKDFAAPGYVLTASRSGTKLLDSILKFDPTSGNTSLQLFTKKTDAAGKVTKEETKKMGFGYGTKGIIIMPGIKIDNKSFYFFEWDALNKKFVSTIEDVKVEISGTTDPKFL